MNSYDFDFGGISCSYDASSIAILPVPYAGTVTYGQGTHEGPAAILNASQNVETYDFTTGKNLETLKLSTMQMIDCAGEPEEVMPRIETAVAQIVSDGKQPFMLGGEHSITGPAVRAVVKHFGESQIGVVQLDAHADLRQSYSGTIHSHASVMSRVREVAPAVQLGVRSCSIEEAKLIEKQKYIILSPEDSLKTDKLEKALETLPEKIYLTVDIDSIDPSIIPSTGTPEPGGYNWYEINKIIETIGRFKKVIGADLVELAPIEGTHAPDFTAAKLAFNILSIMSGEPTA